MASEEERAAIMAEYLAGNDAEEEEADFDPTDEDPDESDAYEDSDGGVGEDEDEEKGEPKNYAVLDGHLSLNDEGRVVFSGTWSMKLDLDAASANKDGEDEKKEVEEDGGKKSKKKKPKFKLKSKQIMSNDGPLFDIKSPTVAKKKDPQTIPTKRTMLFDGFFFTSEEEGHKKIKERDVEITFAVVESTDEETKENEKRFQVAGRGCNEFGSFSIDGIYKVDVASSTGDSAVEENGKKSHSNSLVCDKKYTPVSEKRRSDDDDDDDDDEMSDAPDADYGELVALNEEAHMSVEELRKRYYGGHADDDVEAKPSAKKAKTAQDDSDDDGCGF